VKFAKFGVEITAVPVR